MYEEDYVNPSGVLEKDYSDYPSIIEQNTLKLPDSFLSFNEPKSKKNIFYNEHLRYLVERGTTQEDIRVLGMGFDPETKRIIMPSYNSYNELNYFVGRGIEDYIQPKYINPPKEKQELVFNEKFLEYDGDSVYIVEGPFDFLKLDYLKYNVICTLGSQTDNVNSYLFKSICSFKKVYICYDRDAYKKMFRFGSKLKGYISDVNLIDWRHDILKDKNDLGEFKSKIKDMSILKFIPLNEDTELSLQIYNETV